jgi:hypothetical protein
MHRCAILATRQYTCSGAGMFPRSFCELSCCI